MIGAYDDGDWVAILLTDVNGRHPGRADEDAVWAVVTDQAARLTPPPPVAILTLADRARRAGCRDWGGRRRSGPYLPGWLAPRAPEYAERVAALPPGSNDHPVPLGRPRRQLPRPADGSVLIFDWGMCCIGPRWADEFCFAFALAGPGAAGLARRIAARHGVPPTC